MNKELYELTYDEWKQQREIPRDQKEMHYGNLTKEHSFSMYEHQTRYIYYTEIDFMIRSGKEEIVLPEALYWFYNNEKILRS